jgi:6-pyruvoyltetrahydropterin/6-carboxytetrahydropterin synthase
MPERTFVKIRSHFDAAHRLENYNGPCQKLHGHRWYVEAVIEGPISPVTGMIVDFGEIKRALNSLLPDHEYINEVYDITDPTAEYLADKFYYQLTEFLVKAYPKCSLYSIEVWETPESSAIVMEGEQDD